MTDLRTLVPKGEEVWVTYYRKDELLFFLTGPAGLSSTLTAKQGSFKMYSAISMPDIFPVKGIYSPVLLSLA